MGSVWHNPTKTKMNPVRISGHFALSSRPVNWNQAADHSIRKLLLQAELGKKVAIASLKFDPAAVAVSSNEVEPQQRFEINVTPVSLSASTPARIDISGHVDGHTDQKAALLAQLK